MKRSPAQETPVTVEDAESKYLSQLEFDESTRGSWVEVLFSNARLLVMMAIGLLVFGALAFARLPRQLNPDVDIPAVMVITTLPGASPKDVEQLVTEKLEKAAPNLPNLDQTTSSSTEGVSVVTFMFLSTQDSDEAAAKVKEEIDALVGELPEDANEPRIQKLDVNDQPFLIVGLVGDTDRLSLSRVADRLKDKLEKVNGLRKVELSGQETEEIVVELDPASLRTYHLTEAAVSQVLRANNLTFPSGRVQVGEYQYSVAVESELTDVEKVRSLIVSSDGKGVSLGQVAKVYQRTKEISRFASYQAKDGQPQMSVQLAIYKGESEAITSAEQKVRVVLKDELAAYPHLQVIDITNFTTEITKTFADLQSNFASSIALMFLVLLVFLGFRQASVSALSIPLVIMSAIGLTYAMGLSLNFLTLFSLLLALSLIGDDAIVMADATTTYGKKFPPLETGLMVFRDFFIPIWVGTITVVWSFVPLLMASGIIGEFIKPIPLVVTATLLSSTAIATLINLPLSIVMRSQTVPKRVIVVGVGLAVLMTALLLRSLVSTSPYSWWLVVWYVLVLGWVWILRKPIMEWVHGHKAVEWLRAKSARVMSNQELISLSLIVRRYRRLVEVLVVRRTARVLVYVTVVGLMVLSVACIATGLLKTEFFPPSDQPRLYVNVEGPAGWQAAQTSEVLAKVQAEVEKLPEVVEVFSLTGGNFSPDGPGGGSGGAGGHRGYLTLVLKDRADRDRDSGVIAEELRNTLVSQSTEAKITVTELQGGPPAGADLQINIKGESLLTLETISNDFQKILKEVPGTINYGSSLQLTPGQLTVTFKPKELAERGLNAQQVGGWLRTSLSGTKVTDTIVRDQDTDIVLSVSDADQTLDMLSNMQLPGNIGTYTLAEVATISLENSPTAIEREDGQRVVRVTSGVSSETTAPVALAAFQEKAAKYELPLGYSWDVGGVNEENEKSVQSIIQAMGLSFFLILVTMVLQLQSFRKALLVMVVIPLAMIGVILNFTLFGIPLSFPALIGVLSLFGIVVNNALMVMEKINLNLHHGFTVREAVADGAASRVQAIFLTTLSSMAGLLPVTLSDPLWQGLGGAIIAGMSVSGLLILALLPSMYIEVLGSESAEELKKHS